MYYKTAKEAIEELKTHPSNSPLERGRKGCVEIIAVEQNAKSLPYTQISYSFPVALILGNETFGVTKETLALADHIAEIPMWGINRSLNVIVSAAIVSYHVMGSYNGKTIFV